MTKKNGRPSKLTAETQATIIRALKAGSFVDAACALAGVTYSTYAAWLVRGNKEDPGQPHRDFLEAVKKALAEAEVGTLARINKAGERNWQALAWIMERRFGRKWALKRETGEMRPANAPTVEVIERQQQQDKPAA